MNSKTKTQGEKVGIKTCRGRKAKYHKIRERGGDVELVCGATSSDRIKVRDRDFAEKHYDKCRKCYE